MKWNLVSCLEALAPIALGTALVCGGSMPAEVAASATARGGQNTASARPSPVLTAPCDCNSSQTLHQTCPAPAGSTCTKSVVRCSTAGTLDAECGESASQNCYPATSTCLHLEEQVCQDINCT